MMNDLNVVIAGAAGEGLQTVEDVLAETISVHEYAVLAFQEFESRIRGRQKSYSIRISEKPINATRETFAARFMKNVTDKPLAELKPVSLEKITEFLSNLRSG